MFWGIINSISHIAPSNPLGGRGRIMILLMMPTDPGFIEVVVAGLGTLLVLA